MYDPRLPGYPLPAPDKTGPGGRTPRVSTTRTATRTDEREMSYAGAGSFVPVIYGRARTGALVSKIGELDGDLVLLLVWCLGEVDAVESVHLQDGAEATEHVVFQHYQGTAAQGVDPTLAAAFAGWTNNLVATVGGSPIGLCYSVARISSAFRGEPRFIAQIRGRKVHDPRDAAQDPSDAATWSWSDNPALCLADFEASQQYGRGRAVDWVSVSAAADACDDLVGGDEKRRLVGLVLDRQARTDDWTDTLRAYAGCFLVDAGDVVRLVPDRPVGSVTRAIDDQVDVVADASGAPVTRLSKRGLEDAPTVVRITYTDTSGTRWRDADAVAYYPGVLDGGVEWRESRVRLPGITRYSQAYREAVERLNAATLTQLDLEYRLHDEGLLDEPGDVVSFTSVRGLTDKWFRVIRCVPSEPGRWDVSAVEYSDGIYSDSVAASAGFDDTTLPSPFDLPAVTGLQLQEVTYQKQNGTFSSRIDIVWDPVGYAYLMQYDIEVWDGADLVHSSTSTTAAAATPALNEGVEYKVQVRAVSTVGASGAWAVAYLTTLGKQIPPGDVPSITGMEVGGQVRLAWARADNPTSPGTPDPDVWRYEVRYVAAAGSWDDGTVLDIVDALRYVSTDVPEGDYDLMVKAIDSVGQYSASEARVALTITQDSSAYQADHYEFASTALESNLHSYRLHRADAYARWVTDPGTPADQVFAATPLDASYPAVAATYREGTETGVSEWLTDTWDAGLVLTGSWVARVDEDVLSGTVTHQLELSEDGIAWTAYTGLSAKTSARYARVRLQCAIADTFAVALPGPLVSIAIVPREESANGVPVTSSATGPTTIVLSNDYSKAVRIVITPLGVSAISPVVDNIVMGSGTDRFDVYLFDSSGAQIAAEFLWEFRGV